MVKVPGIDVASCEMLAQRAMQGDTTAQRSLIEHLWPFWIALARANKGMGALARSEDHVREVAVRLAEKLGSKSGHALRLYSLWRQKNPDKDFGDWIRIVQANIVRGYVREEIGSVRLAEGEISAKRLLNEFTSSPLVETQGFRPPYTAKQVVRQVVEFARAHLPSNQLRALELWLEGASYDELDRELEVQPGAGKDLMRAGVAVLRRTFAAAPDRISKAT